MPVLVICKSLTLGLVIGCGRISNSFKLLWVSLLPARMTKIHSKIKVLEWSQQISHCKSMQIFYDAQGQLTPNSEIGSTLNSNSSKLLWLSLLPARTKKIQLKMKVLEWSQQCNIIHQFFRCSRAANSLIGDGILTKFKLIRALIVVFLICKNEYDLYKFESTRVVTPFLPL